METIRKYLLWLFLVCFVFIAAFSKEMPVRAISGKPIKTVSIKIAGKKVNGATISLPRGESAILHISTSPKLLQKTATYKSSKPSVVSVNRKGKMTAKKAGISKISITVKASGYKNKTALVNVRVPDTGKGKTLIIYFSCTGTTKGVAEKIADTVNADTYEIKAKEPYTATDLDYSPSRSAMEQDDPSARPAIVGEIDGFDSYSVIYLGYPIWSDEEPRIIDTFLESYNFSGKTIAPFCTSGGSGIRTSVENIKKLVPSDTNVLNGKRFSGTVSKAKVKEWVKCLGL